jgi:HD-GYP domain-containing protein (c-di-GMP phosphodiesterase class II)
MIVEKHISQIKIGTYIIGIVRQRGEHKIRSKGWVKSYDAINQLKKLGVEIVQIDTSKVLPEEVLDSSDIVADEGIKVTDKTAGKQSELTTRTKESFNQSVRKAKIIFDECKEIQRKVLSDVLYGRKVDVAPVEEMTNQTTEAVFENPDALACILNIRKKDEYLLEHSTAVSILMAVFCRYLDIDIKTTKELALGAFLHDVGKIMIPDNILNKPAKLTVKEFEIMKTHVQHSVDIIKRADGISELSLEVAALHHEKLDGTGYPNALTENRITLYGRMIAICDIFDALTAHRVYKNGMAQVKAFSILKKMADKNMLDLSLVHKFIKCIGVYPVGSLVKLNSNQLAVVKSRNPNDPISPNVKAFYNIDQSHFVESKDIDLSDGDSNHIEKGVRADDFNLDMNKILEFLIMEA